MDERRLALDTSSLPSHAATSSTWHERSELRCLLREPGVSERQISSLGLACLTCRSSAYEHT